MMVKRLFTYFLMGCLFLSCDGRKREKDPMENSELLEVGFTRGVGSGNAYRIYLNGLVGTTTEGIESSGTYCDKVSGEQFVPCFVDNEGNYVDSGGDPSTQGLRAINGPYKMHIVFPAVKNVKIPYAGYTDISGYLFQRDSESNIYLSEAVDVNVTGVYLDNSGGSEYIYDASSLILRQPKSRLKVIFACGEDIESTTLRGIVFDRIIGQGYFSPAMKRYYYEESNITSQTIFDGELVLTRGQSQELDIDPDDDASDYQYLLSMNYGEKDDLGNPKYTLPSFIVTTGSSDADLITFNAALGLEFKWQHAYTFKITINSTYANVTVTALPWSDGGLHNPQVDGPQSWSVDIPLKDGANNNLLEWEEIDVIGGTIE